MLAITTEEAKMLKTYWRITAFLSRHIFHVGKPQIVPGARNLCISMKYSKGIVPCMQKDRVIHASTSLINPTY